MRWRRARLRVTGRPPSANGASSSHAWWGPLGADRIVEVAATLEVLDAPRVPALYFWALQAGFVAGRAHAGAAHLGLQWHPGHPQSRAVNFGGYRSSGGELTGSGSPLPSATGNPNTRDYAWQPGRPYRLAIRRTDGRWRGSVTDVLASAEVTVRDLDVDADGLADPVVWAEVFARCDDPTVRVRWSDFVARSERGALLRPDRVRVSYQEHAAGGCDNTSVHVEAGTVVQATSLMRRVPSGAVLMLAEPQPTT